MPPFGSVASVVPLAGTTCPGDPCDMMILSCAPIAHVVVLQVEPGVLPVQVIPLKTPLGGVLI